MSDIDFTLYNAPQSTCSQRVRFVMHIKELPFTEILLDLFSGDQLKPEYLSINPNGVVPALVHNTKTILDSAVILEYLEDICPKINPMRSADPVIAAEMRTMMRFIDEVPTPAIRIPSYNLAFLPHFQAMSKEEFEALADSKPLRREFLLKMGQTGFSEADMNEALSRLQRAVLRMDEWIEQHGGSWLQGNQISYADIAVMPVIVRMQDINLSYYWDNLPKVAKWLEKIHEHAAFSKTFYHGSLLTEKYPHLSKNK
jgi:glutathione S-transferase